VAVAYNGKMKKAFWFIIALTIASIIWSLSMRGESATLQFDEISRPVSAVCGDGSGILLTQPNTLFTYDVTAKADSRTLILQTSNPPKTADTDVKLFTELPGVVACMLNASEGELYALRYVYNVPDGPENYYFDVLDKGSGNIIRSTNLPRALLHMYMLQDGAICAWSNSFQLFSTDRGKTWVQLPKTIRGPAYGCGYGDSMFFLRGGILSEVKGEAVRQGRLEETIIVRVNSTARSLVVDEDSGQLYTVLKKGGNFVAHQISGQEKDIFLCDDSEDPGHGVVELHHTKSGKFYASASFMQRPFHKANYVLATDGKSLLRSRYYMGGPYLNGQVNNLIFFYAKTGLQDYVFFHIDTDKPLQ
jgi:hypothetical protein